MFAYHPILACKAQVYCVYKHVVRQCKKTNPNKKTEIKNDKPTHKTAHLQAPTLKPKLRLAKELFSCKHSNCSTDNYVT